MSYHEIKADPTLLSDKHFSYATYTENLRPIQNTPWKRNHGSSLADVHKQVGEDLVEDPGFPEMIFLPSEIRAAEMRAQCCEDKIEDVVCTLVYRPLPYGPVMTESVLHSQLDARIKEIQTKCYEGKIGVYILMAYSEETRQEFWYNDFKLNIAPRMPKYDAKYDRKRQHRGAGL